MRAATPTSNVTVFAPVDVHALEVAGVMDVFNEANAQAGCAALYAVTLAAERREAIRWSSSLRYLERFPLTEIKIDRSFVAGLPASPAKRVIVEAVIKLGAELGVRVIAEGVEREAERDALAAMGCAFAQGYLFSPPLDAEAFAAMAADRRSEAPA
jgi:predicted signal transduction protein with EAL and GGDEF domain